jgi:type II secretory pathway component PulK
MSGQRGSAMIYAMLLVLVLGAASALLFTRGQTMRQEAKTDVMRDASFHAAEGGLAHARHALAKDAGFTGADLQIGRCRVTSSVTRTDSGWSVLVMAHPGCGRIEAVLAGGEGLPAVREWK